MSASVTFEPNIELFRSQANNRGFRLIPLVGKKPDKAKARNDNRKLTPNDNPILTPPHG